MNRRSILLTIIAVLMIQITGLASAQPPAAQLKGAIVDENGRALAGVRVLYTRKPRVVLAADKKW